MLYASFLYGIEVPNRAINIGDYIQTVAVERLLPRIDLRIDRDSLNEYSGREPVQVVMNGWFTHAPQNWPPSPNIEPVFVGFHMASKAVEALERHKKYFEGRGSIGCRDHGTAARLQSWGIPSHVTYCCTLTFPPRDKEPENGKTFLVDADNIHIPRSLKKNIQKITHITPGIGEQSALSYARELIDYYRSEAKLVITTRLHCVLPCIAMGIPVIFFGKANDYRTNIISDFGVPIYEKKFHKLNKPWKSILETVDWSPKPVDIDEISNKIAEEVKEKLR